MPARLSRALTKGLAFFKTAVARRLARALRPAGTPVDDTAAPWSVTRIGNYHDYLQHVAAMGDEYERRRRIERDLITDPESFLTAGRCYVCRETVDFYSDFQYAFRDGQGRPTPNWRERLVCPRCRLNNRMRACIHIFDRLCRPAATDIIYLTEQTTPVYAWFKSRYPSTVGSEYLGDSVPRGQSNAHGIRNESVTRLTFADESFDHILSFDVLEHVPEYEKAFQECLRCLKPGGWLLFSVPFDLASEKHIIRARLDDHGRIEHLLPPEYHGDPLNTAGCLCFYHFGWELLAQLRSMGFASADACLYWSREYGYLGGEQILFLATKGADRSAAGAPDDRKTART